MERKYAKTENALPAMMVNGKIASDYFLLMGRDRAWLSPRARIYPICNAGWLELEHMTEKEQMAQSADKPTDMEASGKRSCKYDNGAHPHGSEVSDGERAMICINGKWVNKDDLESVGC